MVVVKNTVVNHWRYDDGWHIVPTAFLRDHNGPDHEFRKECVGWHCWLYAADGVDINDWMKTNMKGVYDCTFRFNSGDPMHTIYIADDEDASLFKLRWM